MQLILPNPIAVPVRARRARLAPHWGASERKLAAVSETPISKIS
jgi:hypothetical protein